MNESILLKISLFFSISGLVALFFLSYHIQSTDTTVKKLFHKDDTMELSGKIVSIKSNGKTTFLTIEKPILVKAIAFSNISLMEGQEVKVTGKKEDDVMIVEKIVLD
ncbi:MAG: hypothetical protein NDI94_06025 [Candidatus Woesearchaeota archaeon]|nr:hypothetical protein [Candidatus Woesearchaeota archaeon]